jgi:hypothetical protein
MPADVVWTALKWPSLEHASTRHDERAMQATGHLIAVLDGVPAHIDYAVHTDGSGATRRVEISVSTSTGTRSRRIDADGKGHWWDTDALLPGLDGCLDVDISITPLTNTLPLRRLGLRPGQSREIAAAYLSVPDLGVQARGQRYTALASGFRYRVRRLPGRPHRRLGRPGDHLCRPVATGGPRLTRSSLGVAPRSRAVRSPVSRTATVRRAREALMTITDQRLRCG